MEKKKIYAGLKVIIYKCSLCGDEYVTGVVAHPHVDSPFGMLDEICLICLKEKCKIIKGVTNVY